MPAQLKNEQMAIPGGYRFLQPETGFQSVPWSSIDSITNQILQHRAGNSYLAQKHGWSTDYATVRREVCQYNVALCHSMGWGEFLTSGEPPPDVPVFTQPPRPAVGVVEAVKRTAAGVGIVAEWLGAGLKPVDGALAEKRAWTCACREDGNGCPLNKLGNFWQRMDAAAAKQIKTLMEVKNDFKATTSYDDKLHSCMACDCFLPLKVFSPLDHILKHTSPEVESKLDVRCWILGERKGLQK